MKKFTAIALCFVLTASIMTACRSKAPAETDGSTTAPATTATEKATTPTILPTVPTDATENATGGMDTTAPRGRRMMPMP